MSWGCDLLVISAAVAGVSSLWPLDLPRPVKLLFSALLVLIAAGYLLGAAVAAVGMLAMFTALTLAMRSFR
jgi:hypothetical protein